MTDPASSIIAQAHRKLAKLPTLRAKKAALAVVISAAMDEWAALDAAEREARIEADQMRRDARDIRNAERRVAGGNGE